MTQDIRKFITENIESAQDAWQLLGGTEQFYRFGPISICVRHIGNTLINTVTPAIRHALAGNLYTTDGMIYALDAGALDMEKPPAIWPFATDTHQGHQRIHWDQVSGLALNSDETRGIWQLFNLNTCKGLYWVRNEQGLPSWEAGSPLRIFLHWIALQKGFQLLHAAGLEWKGCGILLTGRGGSGKSTTTAAAVYAGWKTVGDDFVLFKDSEKPVACCIYDTIKLTQHSLDKIPDLSGRISELPSTSDDKARLHLTDNFSQQLAREISINAIFVLHIKNRKETTIVPVSKAVMMNALAPTTMFMLKTGMKESFDKMTALIRQLPCYVIQMSPEPQEVVDKLAFFLEERKMKL